MDHDRTGNILVCSLVFLDKVISGKDRGMETSLLAVTRQDVQVGTLGRSSAGIDDELEGVSATGPKMESIRFRYPVETLGAPSANCSR